MNSPEAKAKEIFRAFAGTLPVDPVSVARDLGCVVDTINNPFVPKEDIENKGVSGCAYVEDGVRHIRYSFMDPPVRQRFTVAHELGHHVLGHTLSGKRFRDTPSHYTLGAGAEERQANEFAAELLMPSDLVRSAVLRSGIVDIKQLADAFGVSTQAIEIRLRKLGLVG